MNNYFDFTPSYQTPESFLQHPTWLAEDEEPFVFSDLDNNSNCKENQPSHPGNDQTKEKTKRALSDALKIQKPNLKNERSDKFSCSIKGKIIGEFAEVVIQRPAPNPDLEIVQREELQRVMQLCQLRTFLLGGLKEEALCFLRTIEDPTQRSIVEGSCLNWDSAHPLSENSWLHLHAEVFKLNVFSEELRLSQIKQHLENNRFKQAREVREALNTDEGRDQGAALFRNFREQRLQSLLDKHDYLAAKSTLLKMTDDAERASAEEKINRHMRQNGVNIELTSRREEPQKALPSFNDLSNANNISPDSDFLGAAIQPIPSTTAKSLNAYNPVIPSAVKPASLEIESLNLTDTSMEVPESHINAIKDSFLQFVLNGLFEEALNLIDEGPKEIGCEVEDVFLTPETLREIVLLLGTKEYEGAAMLTNTFAIKERTASWKGIIVEHLVQTKTTDEVLYIINNFADENLRKEMADLFLNSL